MSITIYPLALLPLNNMCAMRAPEPLYVVLGIPWPVPQALTVSHLQSKVIKFTWIKTEEPCKKLGKKKLEIRKR